MLGTLNDIYRTEELAHVLTDEMSNHNFDDLRLMPDLKVSY